MAATQTSGSSWGCCLLKILAVVMALAMIVAIAIGVVFWRSVSWMKNIAQNAPAQHAPLAISEGEKEDVQRVKLELSKAEQANGNIDESVSPTVLNGLIAEVIAEDAAKGKDVKDNVVRFGFDGEHLHLETTVKFKDQGQTKYANLVATFDVEIENGKINKLDLYNLQSGGEEAPTMIRWFLNIFLQAFKEGINNGDPKHAKEVQGFEAVKLLKREGDRLHIIIDASKLKKAKASAEAGDDEKDDSADVKKDTGKKSDF